ncbi:hypothetical protein EJB05_11125, partial [Eragrostis curvula]
MASTAGDTLPASAFLDDDHDAHPLFLDHPAAASSFFPAAAAQEPNQPPPPAAEARKPRKRARASRRPPTTVLTADASNFRAMVQEFTGFPAPPPAFAPHLIGPGAGGALFGAGLASPRRPSTSCCVRRRSSYLLLLLRTPVHWRTRCSLAATPTLLL